MGEARQIQTKKARGRPLTFEPKVRYRLAELVAKHGARHAAEISSIPISVGTLLKIAREFGIDLKQGRRPKRAA